MRVLKNGSQNNLKTIFRGRKIEFRAKHSKVLDWNEEEDRAEYKHWTELYSFIYDITKRVMDEREAVKKREQSIT